MARTHVVGASLAGLAAAARLAKAGHEVVVHDEGAVLGGRHRDPAVWGPALALPAAWKDLFRKSGRILDATLATRGLALTPAPPAIHLMPDGKQLRLPTERAQQSAMIRLTYGEAAARAWQDRLDRHDATWQLLRPLGLEADEALTRERWHALRPEITLADEAAALGPLGPLVEQLAWPHEPADVPAFVCARLCVDRTFGRWQVTDDGDPVPPIALLEALVERVSRRAEVRLGERVSDVAELDGVVVDATSPWSGLSPAPRALRPALVPSTRTELVERPEPEVVDHARRTTTHAVRTAEGWLRVTRDFAAPVEAPWAGAAWTGAAAWRIRPTVTPPPPTGLARLLGRARPAPLRAHAACRGGGEPWQQLLTAALAAYAAHEATGGASIRPADDPRKQDG